MIGTALAHYRVNAKIDAGGMGEVWRATDTKLGREVALKVLPADVAQDPERLARFEREAKVLASLNHPNIATLFGLETVASGTETETETGMDADSGSDAEADAEAGSGSNHESVGEGFIPARETVSSGTGTGTGTGTETGTETGPGSGATNESVGAGFIPARDGDRAGINPAPTTFLVMELVEGEDLSERTSRGPIPIDEAIPIALQIAEALEEDFHDSAGYSFDLSSEGERILVNSPAISFHDHHPVVLVTDWFVELQQLVGRGGDR